MLSTHETLQKLLLTQTVDKAHLMQLMPLQMLHIHLVVQKLTIKNKNLQNNITNLQVLAQTKMQNRLTQVLV